MVLLCTVYFSSALLSVDKYAPGKTYCIIKSSWVVSRVDPEKYVLEL